MRILHLVADGSPGGGTTNILGLIDDLITGGLRPNDVALVVDRGSYMAQQAKERGIELHEVSFFRSRFDPSVLRGVRQAIDTFRPTIVHAHGGRGMFQLASRTRSRTWKAIYTVRGYHFTQKPFPLRQLAVQAERRISAFVDRTVFVCHADHRLSQRWGIIGNRSCTVIHNGFDPSVVSGHVNPIPRQVAFLGRLNYQKDPLLFLDVAAELTSRGYTFKLIGGGEMEEVVRQKTVQLGLQTAVTFCGALPHQRALAELQTAQVLLFPSRWEGFPIAPIEAMYMGVPVVASAVDGVPEIIDDGTTGFLISTRHSCDYAAAVRRVCEDPALWQDMSTRGREDVLNKFTRSRTAQKYLVAYEQILSSDERQDAISCRNRL